VRGEGQLESDETGGIEDMNGYLVRRRRQADRLINNVVADFFEWPAIRWSGRVWNRNFPAMDLWEDGENFYAEVEVPGLKMEDVEILVHGNELTVKGSPEPEEEREGVNFHVRERSVGEFGGKVQLPKDVDVEKVEAELENGVLRIKLPKASSALPRKVEVRSLN
jgi:HSP20 family protein